MTKALISITFATVCGIFIGLMIRWMYLGGTPGQSWSGLAEVLRG